MAGSKNTTIVTPIATFNENTSKKGAARRLSIFPPRPLDLQPRKGVDHFSGALPAGDCAATRTEYGDGAVRISAESRSPPSTSMGARISTLRAGFRLRKWNAGLMVKPASRIHP